MLFFYTKPLFYTLLYVVFAFLMLFFRDITNYKTPDEIYFLYNMLSLDSNNILINIFSGNKGLQLKYYITIKFVRFLYQYGEIAIYIFNISLVSISLFLSSRCFNFKKNSLCDKSWLMLFFMPNVLFFSVSILRDIFLFSLVVLLLFCFTKMYNYWVFFIVFMIFVMRPELGLSITVAFAIVKIELPSFRNIAVIGYLFISFVFMMYLYLYSDFYLGRMERILVNNNIGIMNFCDMNMFFPYYLASNVALYLFPLTDMFFVNSKFGNLLIIGCLINFYIILSILFRYKFSYNKNDKISDFSMLALVTYIPIAANETDSLSAIRHVIYILPFLYMYFSRSRKMYIDRAKGSYGY